MAKEVREQKLAEGQEIGKLVLLAEAKLGELFNQMPKTSGGDRRSENFKIPPARKFESNESESESDDEEEPPPKPKPKLEVAAQMGFNKNQVADLHCQNTIAGIAKNDSRGERNVQG